MEETAQINQLWIISLAVFFVVTVVVAILLRNIRRTAGAILETAQHIWTHGKLIASNTIQIPLLLGKTKPAVQRIDQTVTEIVSVVGAIHQHADTCRSSCPRCVIGRGR